MTEIRKEAFDNAMSWKAKDLEELGDWHHIFSDEELEDIDSALQHAVSTGKDRTELTREDFPLPSLESEFPRWMEVLNHGAGLFNIKGLPRDKYTDEEMATIQWGIGTHVGVGVSQNAAGDLLSHIRDVGANANDRTVRLYKTTAELGFHSDGSDIVALMCLNKARWGGRNRIVSCGAIYNEILARRPDLIPVLYEPFAWDKVGQEEEGQTPFFTMPICTYKEGLFRLFYIGWYIRNAQRHAGAPRLTAEQVQLLDLIDEIGYDPEFHVEFLQEPGDINYVKNSTVLHMRTAFEDFDEPEKKRHLVRLWLTAHGHWADGDAFIQSGIPKKEGVLSDEEAMAQSGKS